MSKASLTSVLNYALGLTALLFVLHLWFAPSPSLSPYSSVLERVGPSVDATLWQQLLFTSEENRVFKMRHFGGLPITAETFDFSNREIDVAGLQVVSLADVQRVNYYCRPSVSSSGFLSHKFSSCTGHYSDVLIMAPTNSSSPMPPPYEPIPDVDRPATSSSSSSPSSSKATTKTNPNNTRKHWVYNASDAHRFHKAYLFAVRNALFNSNGNIYTASKYFFHGGCADTSWNSDVEKVPLAGTFVFMFSEPLLVLTQPYETVFGHEVLEVYSLVTLAKPLLDLFPQIRIAVRANFGHAEKFSRWLEVLWGVPPSSLNLIVLDDKNTLFYAPYVITPVISLCLTLERSVHEQMIAAIDRAFPVVPLTTLTTLTTNTSMITPLTLARFDRENTSNSTWLQSQSRPLSPLPTLLPTSLSLSLSTSHAASPAAAVALSHHPNRVSFGSIILYDRFLDAHRRISNADELIEEFNARYALTHGPVIRFFGNESLEDTVKLFRRAVVFVGAHGSGMVNLLFVPAPACVIEIRPLNWIGPVIENLSVLGNLSHHVYGVSTKAPAKSPIRLHPLPQFMFWAFDVIDRFKIQQQSLHTAADTAAAAAAAAAAAVHPGYH